MKKLDPSMVESRIVDALAKLPYKISYKGFVGEYRGMRTRVSLECECGRLMNVNAYSASTKPGCRSCCNKKFKDNTHYLYVLRCGEIGKVGVTSDPVRRIAKVRYNNGIDFKIAHYEELPDKETAFRREALIKRIVCAGGVFDIPEGSTETFRFSQKQLNNIMNLARVG
ncbi:hypothetical protein K9D52_000808 [Salmonella enterica]|nr:hypothetical protein [Salmonella enterica]EIB6303431.1 hypothetical protein [Salmonella enterica]